MQRTDAEKLLKWLDDSEDEIFIPPTQRKPPSVEAPPARLAVDTGVAVGSVHQEVREIPDDSDNDTPIPFVAGLRLSSSLEFREFKELMRLADDEGAARRQVEWDASCGALDVTHQFWSPLSARYCSEVTKQKTLMHNRELISSDLIKELYDGSEAQKEEMKQMLAMFQQLAASGIGGGKKRR
jgi:hypothetical protein